jgi:hypothetical protein
MASEMQTIKLVVIGDSGVGKTSLRGQVSLFHLWYSFPVFCGAMQVEEWVELYLSGLRSYNYRAKRDSRERRSRSTGRLAQTLALLKVQMCLPPIPRFPFNVIVQFKLHFLTSCAALQYISGRFSSGYRATIGADFITKTLPNPIDPEQGSGVILQIWVRSICCYNYFQMCPGFVVDGR